MKLGLFALSAALGLAGVGCASTTPRPVPHDTQLQLPETAPGRTPVEEMAAFRDFLDGYFDCEELRTFGAAAGLEAMRRCAFPETSAPRQPGSGDPPARYPMPIVDPGAGPGR